MVFAREGGSFVHAGVLAAADAVSEGGEDERPAVSRKRRRSRNARQKPRRRSFGLKVLGLLGFMVWANRGLR